MNMFYGKRNRMLSRRNFLKTTLAATGSAFLPAAPFHTTPYVQNISFRGASILWKSPVRGRGSVEISQDLRFSSSVAASVRELLPLETALPYPAYLYRADLENLSASTEYRYRVFLNDGLLTPGDGFPLRTPGAASFDFLVFGDCGLGSEPQREIAQRMLGENASLALITGDLVYMAGSYAEYEERYFPYYGDMMRSVPFFPSPGNHDYLTQNLGPYLALHALPPADVPLGEQGRYYSFDWGNVHFVSLDTYRPFFDALNGNGKMLEWLNRDLGETNRFWRIVYFHQPPYASGRYDADTASAQLREYLVPILDRHRVDVVFDGHEHSYQRTHPLRGGGIVEPGEGIIYVTTGGGGGNLYPVLPTPRLAFGESAYHYVRAENRGTQLSVRAIRIDGMEIDAFTLAPPPAISSAFLSPRTDDRLVEWDRPVVVIQGRHLAADALKATLPPLPRMLAGTVVTYNGRPLPLLSVSDTKIEVQLPHLRRWARLRTETPNGWAETDVVFP
jgi:3',5'-cyclic AMP phosphodiesterase CpdA